MKIAVVGGGIAGLSAAYYIQKNTNAEVDVYEEASDVGGLAGVFKLEDKYIEKYYHHVFTHDMYLMDLIKELKLEDKLIWKKTKMGYFCNRVTYPFSTPLDLLRFKPLSFFERIRLGASSFFVSRYKKIENLETITSEDFMIRFAGKKGWENFWKPMMKIKFGDNYNKIPAVWLWERIYQRIRSRTGGGKEEVLGYMQGSFYTLLNRLVSEIRKKDGNVFLNTHVQEILIKDGVCKGILVNKEEKLYDYVIFTPALPLFVEMCKNGPKNYIEPLRAVKYDCAMIVLMTVKKKLSDYYWLNISDDDIPFGGLIEHTNFITEEEYNGKHILYFSRYLSPESKYLKMTDEEIKDLYVENLQKIYPEFEKDMIEQLYIFKDRYAQPIWPMKYSKIKSEYKTPIDRLFMANTSQIYPNDRGMNFSIKLGKEVVDVLLKESINNKE